MALVKWTLLAIPFLLSFSLVSMLLGLYYALTEPFALMDPIEVQKLSRPAELILYSVLFLFWLRVTRVDRSIGIAICYIGRLWSWITERFHLSGSRIASDKYLGEADHLYDAEDPRPFVNGSSSSEPLAQTDYEHTSGGEHPDPFVDGSSSSEPSPQSRNEHSSGGEDPGLSVDGSSSCGNTNQNDKQTSSPGSYCAFEFGTIGDFHIDLPEYSTPQTEWVSNKLDVLAQKLMDSRIKESHPQRNRMSTLSADGYSLTLLSARRRDLSTGAY